MKSVSDIINPKSDYRKQWVSAEWTKRSAEFKKTNGSWCRLCRRSDVVTQTHHINYLPGVSLADHPDEELTIMCKDCHREWTKTMRAYRRLFSFWNLPDLVLLFGVLKTAKEKHGASWPSAKLMRELERSNFV